MRAISIASPMIDATAREEVARAIEDYLSARINNDEMERRFRHAARKDRACFGTVQGMLCFSSEFKKHFNNGIHQLADGHSAMIRRWVLFLRSSKEWPEPVPDPPRSFGSKVKAFLARLREPDVPPFAKNEYWPFASIEDWKQFESTSG